jgi:acyl transferase domain-containing protein/acyl carrier protein
MRPNLRVMHSEPVAIVGMGCRMPGGADSPDRLWRLLEAGVDAITEVPATRWSNAALCDADPTAAGKIASRCGGFVQGIDEMDAAFFGISPREAASLDPQQRILLETAWHALEDAGVNAEEIGSNRGGIFVGLATGDYAHMLAAGERERLDQYVGSGTSNSVAAGRLSYVLGWNGPSLCVDTACSSSLVAVHLACQSLRTGECDVALAGGANCILSPVLSVSLSRAHMLAGDGRCKTFDAAADGYGRAEGCGILVLKRLIDAVADNDRILALIRGSAVNHDGRSSGLTVPNGSAQQAVIRTALENAGATPSQVGYVEAHGTGTALGDPIEIGALAGVFGTVRDSSAPLFVGSIKTNLGHLEAAAGVAGLIKVVLALQHRRIPPHLHLRQPNPHIPWSQLPVSIPTAGTPWPESEGRRLAGVSAFGFSGTNAHVVLESAPKASAANDSDAAPPYVLALSAKGKPALSALAAAYEAHLAAHPEQALAEVCATANRRRARLSHRLAVVAEDRESARRLLASYAAGSVTAGIVEGEGIAEPKVAFLFTGQGSQYAGMGGELYRTEPVFRTLLDECGAVASPLLGRDLIELLQDEAALDWTANTQPALFALEYALAGLWRSWGIEPAALLGHSLGEYVAACVAGVFTLGEALPLVIARARLMGQLGPGGAMAAVMAEESRVRGAIAAHPGAVSIAALNGYSHVVISGTEAAVEVLTAVFRSEGVRVAPLRVSHAFHSPLMDPMLEEFRGHAAMPQYRQPQLPVISNVSGQPVVAEMQSPDYWVRHVRQPVRFSDGVAALAKLGCDAFLEVGPRPVLTALAREALPQEDAIFLPSMRPGQPERLPMQESLAALWAKGARPDWSRVIRGYPRPVSLPAYPFQRSRHWFEAGKSVPANCCYLPEWRPAPSLVGSLIRPRRWLVLADDGGIGAELAQKLERRGHRCTLVLAGERPFWEGSDGVLWLRGLDLAGAADQAETAQRGCASLLETVRGLASATGTPPRLRVVTRGGAAAGGGLSSPAQGALHGFCRTLALEHPEIFAGTIDLDPAADHHAARLLEELDSSGEDQVAWRDGVRLAARLVAYSPPRAAFTKLEGTVLVTGGLGGIGLHVGRWLAESSAARVVLAGRRAPDPATARILRGMGPRVCFEPVDIATKQDVQTLLEKLAAGPPLRGIVHAAGVIDDAVLLTLRPDQLARVLAPKVEGAWLLHRLTSGRELDFFVMFSSLASVLGAAGQGAYAAANAFLDALAHQRRAAGLPAVSVNWGPWAGAGMEGRLNGHDRRRIASCGLMPMEAPSAIALLERIYRGPAAQVCVAYSEPAAAWISHCAGSPSVLRDLRSRVEKRDPQLKLDLASVPGERRLRLAREAVGRSAAQVLGCGDASEVDPAQGFMEMGMNSLMVVELRVALQEAFGLPLTSGMLFNYSTVESLARRLVEMAEPAVMAAGAGVVSDEEAAVIISRKFASIRG